MLKLELVVCLKIILKILRILTEVDEDRYYLIDAIFIKGWNKTIYCWMPYFVVII